MNVALVIESLEGGGSERVVRRLAVGLSRRGHRVYVYCLRTADATLETIPAAGVVVREARSGRGDWGLAGRLGRWLRGDRVQVVHAHSCAALVWVFPAAKLLGLPLVHVWHGWPLGPATRAHRLAERLDRFVDQVGVNSESLRSRLPPCVSSRSAAYLPNGIDLDPGDPRESRRRLAGFCGRTFKGPVVLAVGNVRAEKDTCGLLEAFALLRRDVPGAELVCVGAVRDARYGQEVQRVRDDLGLRAAVHFPGAYPDAWRLMAGADVFCLSSRTESFPNVVLEAMSQRVSVVATTVGDVGHLNRPDEPGRRLLRHGQSGLLAPPGDPAALAAALTCVLRDRRTAQARAACAYRDYRRYFTTGRMVRRYERLYADCLGGRARRGTRRRPRILMLGPAPPRIGGMVTSIDLLMKSPLRERYELSRCATTSSVYLGQTAGRHGLLACVGGVLKSSARHVRALGHLAAMLATKRIDILHIHTCSYFTFYRNLMDLLAAKLLGTRVVLHIRGGQFDRFCAGAGRRGQWLIRRGFAAADAIVVLSERWRGALRPFSGRTPMYVVPNGVALPCVHTRQVTKGQPCRFLYLAALTPAKGLDDLIAAAAILRAENVPFELLVAGPATDPPLAVWRQRVRASGLADAVTFVGPVAGSAKADAWAAADCFVHPSHSEGMPNAVLEAGAAGLPVIATAVGSLPEVLRVGPGEEPLALLVPPCDPVALARVMARLATDAALQHQLGRSVRRHIEANYSLVHVSRHLAGVYDELTAVRSTQRGGVTACPKPVPREGPLVSVDQRGRNEGLEAMRGGASIPAEANRP